jgi:hypothetical protein
VTQTSIPSSNIAFAVRFATAVVDQLRWRLAASALVALALAFAEGAGLLLLIPLLGSIGLAVNEGPTSRLAAAVDWAFSAAGLRPNLVTVLGVFFRLGRVRLLYRAHLLLNPTSSSSCRLHSAAALRRDRQNGLVVLHVAARQLTHAVTTDVDRTSGAVYQLLTLLTVWRTLAYVAIAMSCHPRSLASWQPSAS